MSKGKFIVIEGIDGAGKSVQVPLLVKRFSEHNIPLHVTRECSDGPIGQLLRQTYLAGKRKCDEHVINYLYAADRLDHITNAEDGMLNFINDGVNVLSDRYLMSSLAYDTYMHIDTPVYEEAMESIIQRNRLNMDLMVPDITIVIDVPAELALKRINDGREEASIYENTEKLDKIRRSYQNAIAILRERFSNNIVVVDGSGSIDEVSELIWNEVKSIILNT